MIETVLFVGGIADGKRRVFANPLENIDIQVVKGVATWTECPERIPITIERYCRTFVNSWIEEGVVYLISTESPDNLIPLLIEGYRRKE